MSFPRTLLPAATWALALAAASAFAGDGGHALPEACKSEAATLCPGMTPGDGKFGHCMKSQRDKISEPCRAAIKHSRGGHAGHGAASGAKPGKGGGGDGEGPDDE